MRKSLIAALVVFASMILAGCGAVPTGTPAAQSLSAPSDTAVEFQYLAPFRGSELKAGSEVIVAARVAYQLPQAGGRLSFGLMDERKNLLPLSQRAIVLDKQNGETFVTFKVKVPTGIQRLTLVAPVTLPGSKQTACSTSATFRVVPAAPAPEPSDEYRRVR